MTFFTFYIFLPSAFSIFLAGIQQLLLGLIGGEPKNNCCRHSITFVIFQESWFTHVKKDGKFRRRQLSFDALTGTESLLLQIKNDEYTAEWIVKHQRDVPNNGAISSRFHLGNTIRSSKFHFSGNLGETNPLRYEAQSHVLLQICVSCPLDPKSF